MGVIRQNLKYVLLTKKRKTHLDFGGMFYFGVWRRHVYLAGVLGTLGANPGRNSDPSTCTWKRGQK